MSDKKKEVQVIMVSYEDYIGYDFVEPGLFFSVSAMQVYYFYKTSDRAAAQEKCDSIFGPNKYVVKTSKTIKTKSSREDGGYSAYGSNSRKGFASQLKKTT